MSQQGAAVVVLWSVTATNTIGIVFVAFDAATAGCVDAANRISGLRATSSAAKAGERPSLPSAYLIRTIRLSFRVDMKA